MEIKLNQDQIDLLKDSELTFLYEREIFDMEKERVDELNMGEYIEIKYYDDNTIAERRITRKGLNVLNQIKKEEKKKDAITNKNLYKRIQRTIDDGTFNEILTSLIIAKRSKIKLIKECDYHKYVARQKTEIKRMKINDLILIEDNFNEENRPLVVSISIRLNDRGIKYLEISKKIAEKKYFNFGFIKKIIKSLFFK